MGQKSKKQQQQQERNDIYIAFGVIALAGYFVLSHVWKKDTPDPIVSVDPIETPFRNNVATNADIALIAPSFARSEWSADLPQIERKTTGHISTDTIIQLPGKASSVLAPIVVDTVLNTSESTSSEEIIETIKEEVATSRDTHNSTVDEDNVVVVEETSTPVKDCSIAVGLYLEQHNANKQIRKLRASGLDVYQEPLKRFTKVAVRTSCDDAHRVLRIIRSRYASDAFIEE